VKESLHSTRIYPSAIGYLQMTTNSIISDYRELAIQTALVFGLHEGSVGRLFRKINAGKTF
jgi:hypothetical protein